tara:strand:+ start:388 stop:513 length:126 start_codon:yes stop_codon:yes gene_type:complete
VVSAFFVNALIAVVIEAPRAAAARALARGADARGAQHVQIA